MRGLVQILTGFVAYASSAPRKGHLCKSGPTFLAILESGTPSQCGLFRYRRIKLGPIYKGDLFGGLMACSTSPLRITSIRLLPSTTPPSHHLIATTNHKPNDNTSPSSHFVTTPPPHTITHTPHHTNSLSCVTRPSQCCSRLRSKQRCRASTSAKGGELGKGSKREGSAVGRGFYR